jgi:hypothetical protein
VLCAAADLDVGARALGSLHFVYLMEGFSPALAGTVSMLGPEGKNLLYDSLRSREKLQEFVQSQSSNLPELDQLMPLLDALGVKRGRIMSEALRKIVQYLAGKLIFRIVHSFPNTSAPACRSS